MTFCQTQYPQKGLEAIAQKVDQVHLGMTAAIINCRHLKKFVKSSVLTVNSESSEIIVFLIKIIG